MKCKKLKKYLSYLKSDEKAYDSSVISTALRLTKAPDDNTLSISCMDLAGTYRTLLVKGETWETDDACFVSIVKLKAVLDGNKDGDIFFTRDGFAVIGKNTYNIGVQDKHAETWEHNVITFDFEGAMLLHHDEVTELEAFVLPNVSEDETRYFMNGICMDASDDPHTVRFVATDGRCLAYKDIRNGKYDAMKEKIGFGQRAPILKTTLFKRHPESPYGVYLVATDDMRKAFATVYENEELKLTIAARVIEGQFPNYRRVIPEKNPASVKIDMLEYETILNELETEFKVAGIKSNWYSSHKVILTLSADKSRFDITAFCAEDSGDTACSKPFPTRKMLIQEAKGFTGEYSIAFNVLYLLRAVDKDADDITIKFGQPDSAVDIENEAKGQRFVVMPMQL